MSMIQYSCSCALQSTSPGTVTHKNKDPPGKTALTRVLSVLVTLNLTSEMGWWGIGGKAVLFQTLPQLMHNYVPSAVHAICVEHTNFLSPNTTIDFRYTITRTDMPRVTVSLPDGVGWGESVLLRESVLHKAVCKETHGLYVNQ